ncbi:hypothetical protein QM306_37490, partial [Burkholderia cenocepacia]|nr:hypothetical protein [Burkholderia cenocepacia]
RRRMIRSHAGACRIPMHFTGRLPPAAGRRIESNEQDNEAVALATPPAPDPARLPRPAAQPFRYRVFRISPPETNRFPDRAKGPVASVPSARMRQKAAVHDPHRCRPLLLVPFDVQPEG